MTNVVLLVSQGNIVNVAVITAFPLYGKDHYNIIVVDTQT